MKCDKCGDIVERVFITTKRNRYKPKTCEKCTPKEVTDIFLKKHGRGD